MNGDTRLKEFICGIFYDDNKLEWYGYTIPDLEKKMVRPEEYVVVEATYKEKPLYLKEIVINLENYRW